LSVETVRATGDCIARERLSTSRSTPPNAWTPRKGVRRRLKTSSMDGKKEELTWYYHAIPLAKYLKPGERKRK
jgi:hypothetical protein